MAVEGDGVNKLDDYLRFHEASLSIRSQRQQLLASNIANADTPHYKARDFDFNGAMTAALNKTQAAQGMSRTNEAHRLGANSIAAVPLEFRQEVQGNVDGNTVDMDVERNAFTENALRYEASLTMINMQIKSLLTAIQG